MVENIVEEYLQALKLGQKEISELAAAGRDTSLQVLDELLPELDKQRVQEIGLLEIPAERIVGTKSAGRITAFSPSFRPLLDKNTEFAMKWMRLCEAHLGDTGITDPILCYEYLGNFYVQEGNKRVSVLRCFDAPRIPAVVMRILPEKSDDPRIIAYYEFLDFFKSTRLYTVQYRRPRDYDKLLTFLGKEPGESWSDDERRTFNAYFHYFDDAFRALNTKNEDILPEEAMLLWLEAYSYAELGTMTAPELKKSVAALWEDIRSTATPEGVEVASRIPEAAKPGIISRIISAPPEHIHAAFIHQLDPAASGWAMGHEDGRLYLEEALAGKVTTSSYFGADSAEHTAALIDEAVEAGAQVVFTTAPLMSRATLKAALRHPKVEFLNCSVDQSYSSVRTYYARIFEGKFITGAIAGAMAQDDRIGFIAAYPIYGTPASINAFALGAQLTNPRAQIELRWSCLKGSPQADFLADGIRVISNRDAPVENRMYLDFCNYGTYYVDDMGSLIPLASPIWSWGKFYESVIQRMLDGTWKTEKTGVARNYWLGMDTGAITIKLSDRLPEGVRTMANILHNGLAKGEVNPFGRKIMAQDGSIKCDGTTPLTLDQILHMDWLCANVTGSIPAYDELLPMAQPMVRELGIYRDTIPLQKEAAPHEDPDRIR